MTPQIHMWQFKEKCPERDPDSVPSATNDIRVCTCLSCLRALIQNISEAHEHELKSDKSAKTLALLEAYLNRHENDCTGVFLYARDGLNLSVGPLEDPTDERGGTYDLIRLLGWLAEMP